MRKRTAITVALSLLGGVVLTVGLWEPSEPLVGFDPCTGCPAPCAAACPGQAPTPAGFRLDRCVAARAREPGCVASCAARRACVLGPEHAYLPEALAHHMSAVRLP